MVEGIKHYSPTQARYLSRFEGLATTANNILPFENEIFGGASINYSDIDPTGPHFLLDALKLSMFKGALSKTFDACLKLGLKEELREVMNRHLLGEEKPEIILPIDPDYPAGFNYG